MRRCHTGGTLREAELGRFIDDEFIAMIGNIFRDGDEFNIEQNAKFVSNLDI
jgi:hypothetical protein